MIPSDFDNGKGKTRSAIDHILTFCLPKHIKGKARDNLLICIQYLQFAAQNAVLCDLQIHRPQVSVGQIK